MTRLRALCLAQYPETAPSTRFRVSQFEAPLAAVGVDLTLHPFLPSSDYREARGGGPLRAAGHVFKGLRELHRTIASAREYDVVLVQRNLAPLRERSALSRLIETGVPIVYDFDDAVFLSLVGGRRWMERFRAPDRTFRAYCQASAGVLAGNEYLAARAREVLGKDDASRVRLLPSVIETDRFAPATSRPERLPALGWVGSDTTLPYLERLAPMLRRLAEDLDFRLVVVAGRLRPDLPGLDFEFIPWTPEKEVSVFHELDVGLAPLDDTPWTRGKCGFKAIQYLACGVPCVASPVGPLVRIVHHGESGFHARTEEEWVRSCRELLTDAALRERFGRRGRESVVESYSVDAVVPVLAAALSEAAGRTVAGRRLSGLL